MAKKIEAFVNAYQFSQQLEPETKERAVKLLDLLAQGNMFGYLYTAFADANSTNPRTDLDEHDLQLYQQDMDLWRTYCDHVEDRTLSPIYVHARTFILPLLSERSVLRLEALESEW